MTSVLQVQDLGVSVGPKADPRWLFRGLDLEFPAGRWTAIVGPNGAGKTTLLRVVGGLLPATRGTVSLEGRPLDHWPRRQRAQKIAWLPQQPGLWEDPTAADVVLLGRTPHLGAWGHPTAADHERAAAALARVHGQALAHRRMSTLSGGERQRVMLARMLASDASILLLDEPTAALDLRHTLEVLKLCADLAAEGATVVTALHELNAVRRFADLVVCLGDPGQPPKVGPPAEVLTPEILGPLFGVRVQLGERLTFSLPRRG